MVAFAGIVEVPAREHPDLQLANFYSTTVPANLASTVIGRLTDVAPLEGFKHLKRVRKSQKAELPARLDVLLWPADASQQHIQESGSYSASESTPEADARPQQSALPRAILDLLATHGLDTFIQQVPKLAPATRGQWAEWTKLWPVYWNAPSSRAVDPRLTLTAAEAASMHRWMHRAFDESATPSLTQESSGYNNAAVIVDPSADAVVAVGRDGTAEHPLHHAIMQAIQAAAAINLTDWNVSTAPSGDGEMSSKRQRQEGCVDVSQSSEVQEDPDSIPQSSTRQYLCTGYDCYVVQEPCAMCAMALVHSRVRRVIFSSSDSQQGALGGSFKLHAERSLNHHYAVFSMPIL